MHWRIKFSVEGTHVHCILFCAKHINSTFANCGSFIVRRGSEFESLTRAFSGAIFVGHQSFDMAEAIRENS